MSQMDKSVVTVQLAVDLVAELKDAYAALLAALRTDDDQELVVARRELADVYSRLLGPLDLQIPGIGFALIEAESNLIQRAKLLESLLVDEAVQGGAA